MRADTFYLPVPFILEIIATMKKTDPLKKHDFDELVLDEELSSL